MPETDLEAIQRALGNICIIVDGNQQHTGPKLPVVERGGVEALYMLAAFCFDLTRKLHYIFKATRQFAEHADGRLAREIKADNARLYEEGVKDWKELAQRAEKVMLRLHEEIHDEHERLLEEAAKKR